MTAKIKTEFERARLDEIFAEIERERNVTVIENQKEHDDKRCEEKLKSKLRQNPSAIAGNARELIKENCFKTKREEFFATAYLNLYENEIKKSRKELSQAKTEINVLRNFANAVELKLENAIKTANEQDNHHYYKIFAESVKILLESL